jgi:hypothetical protein
VTTWHLLSQSVLRRERRTPGSSADSVVWADLSQRADQSQELPCRTHVIHGPQADSDHPDGGGRDLTIALIGCSRGNDAAGMSSELGATPPGASASAADQFNEVDVMFARQMIRRPAQAVAMSGMVLRIPACAPEVMALAQQIKASQQRRSTN